MLFTTGGNEVTVGTINLPRFTYGIIIGSGSKDGSMIAIDTVLNIYAAFRNNGVWTCRKYTV